MGIIGRRRPPKNDLTGKIFGFLKVIKMVRNEQAVSKEWMCAVKCLNCDNTPYKIVRTQSLMRGATTSCGCRRDQYEKNTGENNKRFTGYKKMHGKFWGTLIYRAKKRNRDVDITKEYAYQIFLDQDEKCVLSGLPIQFGRSNNYPSENTASVDRIDNSKGYIEGNIQWVHKDINRMRNIYDINYFIEICKKIAHHN